MESHFGRVDEGTEPIGIGTFEEHGSDEQVVVEQHQFVRVGQSGTFVCIQRQCDSDPAASVTG